jgi:hypothetical protein
MSLLACFITELVSYRLEIVGHHMLSGTRTYSERWVGGGGRWNGREWTGEMVIRVNQVLPEYLPYIMCNSVHTWPFWSCHIQIWKTKRLLISILIKSLWMHLSNNLMKKISINQGRYDNVSDKLAWFCTVWIGKSPMKRCSTTPAVINQTHGCAQVILMVYMPTIPDAV